MQLTDVGIRRTSVCDVIQTWVRRPIGSAS